MKKMEILFGLALGLAPLALAADEPRPPHGPQKLRNPQMQQMGEGGPAPEREKDGSIRRPRRAEVAGLPGLGLSEEQEKKLEAGAAQRQAKEAEALKRVEEARKAFEALNGEARNDSGHLSKLRSAHGELKDAERKLEDLRFEAQLELRGLLDQGQLKKMEERRNRRQAARAKMPKEERRQRGPIPRPGQP